MAYIIYVKDDLGNEANYHLDRAVIKIISDNEDGLSAPKIQSILEKTPYKNNIKKRGKDGKYKTHKITRMGLWGMLDRLEKNGDIQKIISEKGHVYKVLPKSKILAEIKGITFGTIFKSGMLIHEEKLLAEFDMKHPIDAIMKYFGFYVLGSLLASRTIAEEQRPDWLKHVLNLEEGNKISKYFDNFIGTNKEILMGIAKFLQHRYKENYAILNESVIKSYEDYQELDKEQIFKRDD